MPENVVNVNLQLGSYKWLIIGKKVVKRGVKWGEIGWIMSEQVWYTARSKHAINHCFSRHFYTFTAFLQNLNDLLTLS